MMWLNNLLDRARKQRVARDVQAQVAPPILLAKGKWIVWKDRVGILYDVADGGVAAIIHLTNDPAGETVGQLQVPVGELRIAKYTEIPAKRRPADPMAALRLGYY